jgi:FkbM family methyltransferase
MFAAKMGHDVVAVEPFYDNILRLHKSVSQEKLEERITLITNAISSKRNEIKELYKNSINIGGQSLLPNKNLQFDRKDLEDGKNKYLVETILFDDLVGYLPKNKSVEASNARRKALLKIDIEGFEPYAFLNASKLFDTIDIQVIFMEWGYLVKQSDYTDLIEHMIKFLYDRSLEPYDNDKPLTRNQWKTWPSDIVWIKSRPLT